MFISKNSLSQVKLDEFIISHYPKKNLKDNFDFIFDNVFEFSEPRNDKLTFLEKLKIEKEDSRKTVCCKRCCTNFLIPILNYKSYDFKV